MPEKQVTKPSGSTVAVRQDLAEEITVGHEIAPTAAAAAAKAEIEARILAAHKWPRDEDQFREDILKACRRSGFADNALYNKPVGRKKNPETGNWEEAFATGFSVRFIEAALQHYGNVHIISRIEWETGQQSKLVVGVLDVQKNTGYSTDAVLDKLVERKEVKKGRTVLGMRENSYGDTVYLVEATHDEFRNVMGAERSKLIRDNGKRLLPPDILDECRALIDATLANDNAKDPDSAKKKVLDKFAAIGVSAILLKEYLGRPLETLTAKDVAELAPLHNGLKEGEFTWADVMRAKEAPAEGEGKSQPEAARSSLREHVIKQSRAAAETAETPAPEGK